MNTGRDRAYLDVGEADDTLFDGRPSVLDGFNVDRLLCRLILIHVSPRYDIPMEIIDSEEGVPSAYRRRMGRGVR